MDKYMPLYKCQLCGAKIATGSPTEVPQDKLPTLLAHVVVQQQYLGTDMCPAPMHIPHKCPDGSAGLASFVGFGKIDKK